MKNNTQTEPLKGEKLIKTVVNKILAQPECWDQSTWHCGTRHCVGGHIQIMGGRKEDSHTVVEDVQELLGISSGEAAWLCAGYRSLGEIHNFAKLFNDGRDRDGRDRDGFDRDGRDRDGRDRDGVRLTPFEV